MTGVGFAEGRVVLAGAAVFNGVGADLFADFADFADAALDVLVGLALADRSEASIASRAHGVMITTDSSASSGGWK